jgi:hypothetical protein
MGASLGVVGGASTEGLSTPTSDSFKGTCRKCGDSGAGSRVSRLFVRTELFPGTQYVDFVVLLQSGACVPQVG